MLQFTEPNKQTIISQSFLSCIILLTISVVIVSILINIYDIEFLPTVISISQYHLKSISNLYASNLLSNLTTAPKTLHEKNSDVDYLNDSFNILDNFYLTITDTNISANPSLPSLAIIGPAKTSTTSIYESLLTIYKYWYRQEPDVTSKGNQWEVSTWIHFLKESIMRTKARCIDNVCYKESKNPRIINFYENNLSISTLYDVPISQFPFMRLLELISLNDLNDTIIQHTNIFLNNQRQIWGRNQSILNAQDYDYDNMHFIYTLDKTPMNFYLPHTALIFGYYFSYKNIIKNVRGMKVLTILRDPYKRYRSWFSQNCGRMKYRMNGTAFKAAYNELANNDANDFWEDPHLRNFRNLIMNRKNEYDDTKIMLEWFKWYYKVMRWRLHNVKHGFFASLYYPQLLTYIHFYKQLGLIDGDRRMFKVITFDYMVLNGKEALHLIQCWVRFALDDLEMCLKVDPLPENRTGELKKLNKRSLNFFPEKAEKRLREYFKPIKNAIERLLRQYPSVILGQFVGFKNISL